MEIQRDVQSQMYELKPTKANPKVPGGVFPKGRILIGRSASCDFIINEVAISAIHAVLEIFDHHAMLYDMNSTNGTYVNHEQVTSKELKVGDAFSFANIEFQFLVYDVKTSHSQVLDTLEPEHGLASPKLLPQFAPSVSDVMPSIVYPLASDPKAELSEYIFEDKNDLYPIFKYGTSKQAAEVIVLFKEQVFSIDYLPEDRATYYITGLMTTENELEFPFLAKNEKFPFVEIHRGRTKVHTLPGFGVFHLSDKRKDTGHQSASIELQGQDLIRLEKGDLQIFVRTVLSPPDIISAPILKRDPQFQKYLFLFFASILLVSAAVNLVELPQQDIRGDSGLERMASIMMKQSDATKKTSKAPLHHALPNVKLTGNVEAFRSNEFPSTVSSAIAKADPAPATKFAAASILKGSLNPFSIRRTVQDKVPQFKKCYKKDEGFFSGEINLAFTIGASGHVSGAGLEKASSLPAEVKKCVIGVLKATTFSRPAGGGFVQVKQPLKLIQR